MNYRILLPLLVATASAATTEPLGSVYEATHGAPLNVSVQDLNLPQSTTPARLSLHDKIGLRAGYAFATGHEDYDCDMLIAAADIPLMRSRHHALMLSLGFASGGKDNNHWRIEDGQRYAFSDNYDRTSFVAMLGYRVAVPLSSRTSLYLGAGAGLDVHMLRVDYGHDWSHDRDNDSRPSLWDGIFSDDDDEDTGLSERRRGKRHTRLGVVGELTAGLQVRVSEQVQVSAGYAFRATTATPTAEPGHYADMPRVSTKASSWHAIYVAVGVSF